MASILPCCAYTNLNIVNMYFFIQYLEYLKAIVLFFIIKKGSWAKSVID